MYPGVPDVSLAFSGRKTLAIPKSVNLRYPDSSMTKFSGLISLCRILFSARYPKASVIQATKNPEI